MRWPFVGEGPGIPLRVALRVEAPEEGGARLRYTGAITAPQIADLGWFEVRLGLDRTASHTPEWTNPADSDPGRVTGETLLLDGSGTLEPALAGRVVLHPDEFLITLAARTTEGNVRFEGPVEIESLDRGGVVVEDVEGCF